MLARDKEKKKEEEEEKENLLLAQAEEKASAALSKRILRRVSKCEGLEMPSVVEDEPGCSGLDPNHVLSVKTRLLQAEAERYNSIRPELYKKVAEVELAVVKNNIAEAKDMAKLVDIQKDMYSRLEAKNKNTKIAANDLLEMYKGMLSSIRGGSPEEMAKASLPILDDLLRTLKDKLKNILEKVVPNEKAKIMEILSILDSAKNRGKDGGWSTIDGLNADEEETNDEDDTNDEEETNDEDEANDEEETNDEDDEMSESESERRSRRKKQKKDQAQEYWQALTILLNCHIVEQHPDDSSLYRLFGAQ